jgi:NosR/NirI family nitrous oxide reductase transcriptional regulator
MKKKQFLIFGAVILILASAGCSAGKTQPSAKTESAAQSAAAGKYKDGTYSGVARGYKKGLNVNVTVQNGKIAEVKIAKNNEDEPYLTDSLVVISQIVETQSTEVDIVAGATKTCEGIGNATRNALEKAK